MNRLIIVILVPILLFAYLGLRLTGIGFSSWIIAGISVPLVFFYLVVWKRVLPKAANEALRALVHLDMGFLSFLSSLVLIRDLLFFPLSWFDPELGRVAFSGYATLGLMALSVLFLILGVMNAWRGARVREIEIPIRGLPKELEGYSIAQISDLHVGPTIRAKYVKRVVNQVNALKPHVTVLTGDIADGDFSEFHEDVLSLGDLKESGPVIFVTGNHEYYWDAPQWINKFKELGMRVLENADVTLEHNSYRVLFAGVVDPAARMLQGSRSETEPDAKKALGHSINADVKVLLSHHPGIARHAAQLGFDLQLSGHTHAGQFFPWTLVVKRVHEFSLGLKACANMWVYVNPGTGTWGPPIRFGTTPEVSLLKLTSAE